MPSVRVGACGAPPSRESGAPVAAPAAAAAPLPLPPPPPPPPPAATPPLPAPAPQREPWASPEHPCDGPVESDWHCGTQQHASPDGHLSCVEAVHAATLPEHLPHRGYASSRGAWHHDSDTQDDADRFLQPHHHHLLELPSEVLMLVTAWLCCAASNGAGCYRVHPLGAWGRSCRRARGLCGVSMWGSVWDVTYQGLLDAASARFVAAMSPVATGGAMPLLPPFFAAPKAQLSDAALHKAFVRQMESASVTYHLELGLLPPQPPGWCCTAFDIEKALFQSLRFCSFQVATARLELQCTRGKVPVIESAAVLTSLLHTVVGVWKYLTHTNPPLSLSVLPMYCICGTWAIYLGAYGLYRVLRAAVRRIPDEAAAVWHLPQHHPSPARRKGVVEAVLHWADVGAKLLRDKRFVGALIWTLCLLLSVALWVAEVQRAGVVTTERILMNVFAPPTFAATLVAWQRSGKKIGLVAGAVVASSISFIIVLPELLFLGLGIWSCTLLLRIHRGYYRPPRANTHLHRAGKALGNTVILAIAMMSGSWFYSLALFLPMLLFALVVLSLWIALTICYPLVMRCRSLGVPLPYNYVIMQALICVVLVMCAE